MKSKTFFPKKDRGFIATWLSIKWNERAKRQIMIIAQAQANLENCGQYVIPIMNKYCILSTREIDRQKKDLGRPHVLRVEQLLTTAIHIAYPKKNNFADGIPQYTPFNLRDFFKRRTKIINNDRKKESGNGTIRKIEIPRTGKDRDLAKRTSRLRTGS